MFPYDTSLSDNDYLLDFNNVGDALVCRGNHFTSEISSKANFLRINQCFGGTVADNIINGNVLITGCKGIDLTCNHFENGGQLLIRNSAITIANNYFHKGLRPTIRIESDINFGVSVINLTNNSFMYLANYDNSILKDGIWKSGLIRDICEYDIELRGEVEFPGGNRYEHGPVATININNSFRCFTSWKNAANVYPLGISICKSFKLKTSRTNDSKVSENSEKIYNDELIPVENFNQRSQLYSANSTLNVSNKVVISSPCVTMDKLNAVGINSLMVNGNVEWVLPIKPEAKEGTKPDDNIAKVKPTPLTYYYQFIWDSSKRFVSPNNQNSLKSIGTVTPVLGYNNDNKYIPSDSKGVLIGVGQNAGCGGTAMLRLFRTPSLVEYGKAVDYVDVPLVNCRILYDNGVSISGYKWKAAESLSDVVITGSTPTQITYMGERVLTD